MTLLTEFLHQETSLQVTAFCFPLIFIVYIVCLMQQAHAVSTLQICRAIRNTLMKGLQWLLPQTSKSVLLNEGVLISVGGLKEST